jgi:ATP-binding cassette subfamily B protein
MGALFSGLQADSYDRQYSDGYLFKRIGDYLKDHRLQVGLAITGFIVVGVVTSLRPVIISSAVDAMVNNTDFLSFLFVVLGVVAISEYVANYTRRRFIVSIIGSIVAQMRKDAFAAAIDRDLAFYDTHKTGKIVSRITSDTQEFGDVMLLGSDVISQFLSVIILIVVLISYSIQLTVVLILTMPLVVAAALFFRYLARIATRQGSRAMAVVNDNIQESVTGISVAKNFRQEEMIYREFSAVNHQSYTINLRKGVVISMVFPSLNILSSIAIAIIVWVGANSVFAGAISAGTWFLFIQGVDRFWFPFMNLSSFWSQFQQGLSAAERIFALIDADNTVNQIDDQKIVQLEGHIVFDTVDFAYVANQPILDKFNIDIKPGESVAFVGHTGAGKSTIAKLITRFYEFQGGTIRIDGEDIRTFDIQSYRSRLGIVPQQPFLFSGTVLDNIRYGSPDATEEEILNISTSIGNGEWLESLPEGLYTHVGERGARLSMGQRQLVSLLRVMVQKPSIFILDEATASIDPFTETQIQEAIDLILSQSTSILIAHRLSTVRSADRIIVLSNGAIIEEGSHEALMEHDGHYAELYNTYFRHQSLSYVENAKDMFSQAGD